jgi:hypothetical protein
LKEEVYRFINAFRWEGPDFEEGIDDQTKIERLPEEITDLKKQIVKLQEDFMRVITLFTKEGKIRYIGTCY